MKRHLPLVFVSLTLFFLPFESYIYAQSDFCATPPGRSEWLKAFQRAPENFDTRSGELLYIPMTIHLVGTDEGSGFFTGEQLADALCTLNSDFLIYDLQFYIAGDIRYISNSTYNEHTFGQGFQMMTQNNVPNTVNCYFVQDPAGACGYFSPGADGVANAKSCSGKNSHTWTHELGHFFSLPHTFSGWEGTDYNPSNPTPNFVNGRRVERVDGDLCNISGDGFCDTPPDYLSYRWSCSAQGVSNVLQSDPVDSTFRSDGSYFMSYASDACMNQFSLGQVDAMRANINNQRPGLLNNSFEPDFIGEDFQVVPVAPDSGATFDNTSAITLEWEAVPNAIGYAVDLDLFVPFNGATISFRSYTTTTNSITMTNLQSNRTYIWKVRPFSRVDGCTSYGPEQSFSVGQFVDSKDLDAQETGLTVFPQPASTGSERLNINAVLPKAELATVRLINGHGQQVRLLNYDVQAGSNQMFIDIKNLTPGFYMLEIVTNSGRWATKTILTR